LFASSAKSIVKKLGSSGNSLIRECGQPGLFPIEVGREEGKEWEKEGPRVGEAEGEGGEERR
jgi:hypothetical protein